MILRSFESKFLLQKFERQQYYNHCLGMDESYGKDIKKAILLDLEDMMCHEKITMPVKRPAYNKSSKSKKKNNTRKQREKRKKEAEEHLEDIIGKVYRLETNFRKKHTEIDECLNYFPNEDKFYKFINKVIRIQVEVLAREIHQCTKSICLLEKQEQACQPRLAGELFGKIQTVSQASPQIQKIINEFICKNEEEPSFYNNRLDLATVKYIFDCDKNKDLFEQTCEIQLARSNDIRYKNLIEDILACIHRAEDYCELDYDSDEQDDEDDQQMSNEEEVNEVDWEELQKIALKFNSHKKRKKKRGGQQDLSSEGVIKRLAGLVIHHESRLKCNVGADWVSSMAQKYVKHRI